MRSLLSDLCSTVWACCMHASDFISILWGGVFTIRRSTSPARIIVRRFRRGLSLACVSKQTDFFAASHDFGWVVLVYHPWPAAITRVLWYSLLFWWWFLRVLWVRYRMLACWLFHSFWPIRFSRSSSARFFSVFRFRSWVFLRFCRCHLWAYCSLRWDDRFFTITW